MTSKQFLSRAVKLDFQIDANMQEACRIRSLAERATAVLSTDLIRRDSVQSVESAAVDLVKLEEEIIRDIQRLVRVKREIREVIARMPRPEERTLLQLRYLCGKKWEEIAVEMNYSWRQIHRIHGRAIEALERMMAHNGTSIHDIL